MPKKDESSPIPASWTKQLKREIRAFHHKTGMEYTVIGSRALQNTRFWERLEKGGTLTLKKADKLRLWMHNQGFEFNQEGENHE